MALETIVFDFDGTIADTKKLIILCASEVLKKHGHRVPTAEEIEKLRARDARDVIHNHLGLNIFDIPGMLAEGWELFYKMKKTGGIHPYEGMLTALESLRRDYEVLILSSNKPKTVKDIFAEWGVNCPTVYHSSLLFGKHFEMKRIVEEKGLEHKKDRIIYVGDEIRDVNACHRAKIGMLAVTWGLNNEEAFRDIGFPKEYLVHTPEKMEEKLRAI